MNDPTDLIARADAALDGVTEGPWRVELVDDAYGCRSLRMAGSAQMGDASYSEWTPENDCDWHFIAASRQLVPALRDALAAALTRAQALQAERDSLAGALQLFADAADELDELGMDDPHQQAPVTYDDCATARAAAAGEPQP